MCYCYVFNCWVLHLRVYVVTFCEMSRQKVPTRKWYLAGRGFSHGINLSTYEPFIVNVSKFVYNHRTNSVLCDDVIELIYKKGGIESVTLLRKCVRETKYWRMALAAFAFLAHRGIYLPSGRAFMDDQYVSSEGSREIIELFEQIGYTPARIAQLIGITSSTIWSIRTGRSVRIKKYVQERLISEYKIRKGEQHEKNNNR